MTTGNEAIEQVSKLSKLGWGQISVLAFLGISGYLDSRSNIIAKLDNYQMTVSTEIKSLSQRIGSLETQVAVQNGFNSRIERLENNLIEMNKYFKKLKKEDEFR